MMKHFYPILFSGPMVRAILEGRKSQTRRIVRPQDDWMQGAFKVRLTKDVFGDFPFQNTVAIKGDHIAYSNQYGAIHVSASEGKALGLKPGEFQWLAPRYGTVGGRLWVRETWWAQDDREETAVYRATTDESKFLGKWEPSIFMPKSICRILLEITDIRIQRLEDISEDDAKAEGVTLDRCTHPECQSGETRCAADSYRGAFANGWTKLNSKRGFPWGTNPWVWCITFKRINMEEIV